jgi:hypothetical protein
MKINIHSKSKVLIAALCILACRSLSAQPVLTGITLYACNSSGRQIGIEKWNTVANDPYVDLFLTSGSSLTGPFINGPTDAGAAISIPLLPGQYTYRIFAGSGETNIAYHAIGLCFNGSFRPAIAAFGASQFSPNSTPPAFQADGSTNTFDLNMNVVPGANSLSFRQGNTLITLTQYSWADPTCYNVDRISAPFGSYGSIGPDGTPDWVGQITLSVTTVTNCLAISTYAGVTITGTPGAVYEVQCATSLNGPWSSLTNFALPCSPCLWVDTSSPVAGTRFYRSVQLQ